MNVKRSLIVWVAVMALIGAGCSPEPKVATERQRLEAAQLGSEAQFAVTVREWARAEKLYVQASKLHADGAYFIGLGAVRMRLGNRSGAKDAYQAAIKACELDARMNPGDPEPWLRHAYLLALLGRADDGRALLKKTEKRFPNDRRMRAFIETKQFDTMITAPGFKESAL